MTDLERFFRHLVANLAAIDPARLHRPVRLGDIPDELMPYRANRRALELDSSEEYELLLLRLCAGEGRLARLDPEAVQTRLRSELASGNPDLGLLREHADAHLALAGEALARAMGPGPEQRYAPPEALAETPEAHTTYAPAAAPAAESEPPLPPAPAEIDDAILLDAFRFSRESSKDISAIDPPITDPYCSYCGGALPQGRQVNFCPHCGQSQGITRCPQCRGDVELGWRHCVACGFTLGHR